MEQEGSIVLEKIKQFIKEVIRKMIPAKNIEKAMNVKSSISNNMISKIEEWKRMYKGGAEWVNNDSVYSLRLEQGIVREFSNIVLNEMSSKVTNEKLETIYKNSIKTLNENLQSGLALGSFIIKPLGSNKVEYITADNFIPIEFDAQGRLTKVIFFDIKHGGENVFYKRAEYHSLDKNGLTIINKAFQSSNINELGKEVPLSYVEEWAHLREYINYPLMLKPDFGYYRNPIKNNIDDSFCGVSIYDSAIDLIKKADIQFGRLDWEFESGERAINVDITALQPTPVLDKNGKTKYKVPKLNERLYKGLNLEDKSGDLYQEFSPEFRDGSIINGLEEYKRNIEFSVSLSYGDLSNPQTIEKTATEIKSAKKRKYNMVTAIQKNLKDCLEDLAYALAFYNGLATSGYEFICDFKDSILVDEETERQQDRQDVSMGVMQLWEYRMKWFGETEEQAKKMIPQQADVMT